MITPKGDKAIHFVLLLLPSSTFPLEANAEGETVGTANQAMFLLGQPKPKNQLALLVYLSNKKGERVIVPLSPKKTAKLCSPAIVRNNLLYTFCVPSFLCFLGLSVMF